mmetsp:Transcript_9497/g.20694  ORF Transcript_9497/g.20694 Transcript_9497/m.20694 type:complete len:216 (+) Transcript_9497:717-1364(+)
MRIARRGGCARGEVRRCARASRRLPVSAAHAHRCAAARRGLPRRVGAQDVRADGDRRPLGEARGAERDAAVDGRWGDDRGRLPRPLHLHAATSALRGGHAAHHAGHRTGRRRRLPEQRRHARSRGVRGAARRVPLPPALPSAGPAHLRARPRRRHRARGAVRLQLRLGTRLRPRHLPRPGWHRRARGAPLHTAAAPRARRRRLRQGFTLPLQHRG